MVFTSLEACQEILLEVRELTPTNQPDHLDINAKPTHVLNLFPSVHQYKTSFTQSYLFYHLNIKKEKIETYLFQKSETIFFYFLHFDRVITLFSCTHSGCIKKVIRV